MKVDIKILKDKTRIRPKKSEVMSLLADSSKAKKTINWKPKYTGKNRVNPSSIILSVILLIKE